MAVEIAWSRPRHQPNSKLTQWRNERFSHARSGVKRIGIVALARKLVVHLW
jgi:transposase